MSIRRLLIIPGILLAVALSGCLACITPTPTPTPIPATATPAGTVIPAPTATPAIVYPWDADGVYEKSCDFPGHTLMVPSQYATIQAAIDASESGDVIRVAAGIYGENIELKDGICVVGEGPAITILQGDSSKCVVSMANDCLLSGFMVRGSAWTNSAASPDWMEEAGAYANGKSGVTIVGCTFADDRIGVSLSGSHAYIENVYVSNASYGVQSTYSYAVVKTITSSSVAMPVYVYGGKAWLDAEAYAVARGYETPAIIQV